MEGGEAQERLNNGDGIGPILDGGQLSYLEHGCTSIPQELGQQYGSKVTRLDLSFNCIRTLEGLDRFTALEELVLDNNEIDDMVQFPPMPKLHTLLINKNKITNVDSFTDTIQASLPSLTYLSMLGNQACPNELLALDKDEEDYQRFRYYVIFKLPRLRFLDSTPVKDSERTEAKRVGSLMKVIKADETDLGKTKSSDAAAEKYNPLPLDTKDDGQHQADMDHTAPKYVVPPKHSLLRLTFSNGMDNSSDGEYTVNTSSNSDDDEETKLVKKWDKLCSYIKPGKRTGTFGRCRYVYYGRHSEGNRFIRNQDL